MIQVIRMRLAHGKQIFLKKLQSPTLNQPFVEGRNRRKIFFLRERKLELTQQTSDSIYETMVT